MEKNIEEGNKLIAIFDSLIPAVNGIPDYHLHWELLMPVVEKISKIPLIGGYDISDTCYPRTFGMINVETGKVMVRFTGSFINEADTLIEATWNAVLEFIKYHNYITPKTDTNGS